MTFYEAAIQILLQAGQPLHAKDIAERAIQENLLSHVGKDPEATMASRLAAMARRSQDRRLVVVEPDTFGLTDWNIQTSAEALEQSGIPEVHDEDAPALRSRERHPKIDKENVRVAGRGDRRRRHEEIDRKRKKRLGPVPEYVFELLGRIGIPVPLFELAAAVREKDLVADDLGREALGAMLASENERREEEGRRPLFALYDDGLAGLQGGAEPSGEEQDYPALVAKAVRRLAEDRRPQQVQPGAAVAGPVPSGAVERAVAEQRQRAIRQLRKRLTELDASGLEALTASMLESMGYRDVRVAKRHKDGALFTTRRRMGLTEVRFAVRVIRGGREVRREEIAELRKDMASHSAQLGVIVSPNDVTREARNEAAQASQALVTLLCADALADQLAERGLGVVTRTVTYVDYDDAAFRALQRRAPTADAVAGDAAEGGAPKRSESAAEERRERRERERKEWRERRDQAREERRRLRAEAEAAQKAEAGQGADEEGASSETNGAGANEAAASIGADEAVAKVDDSSESAEAANKGDASGESAEAASKDGGSSEPSEAASKADDSNESSVASAKADDSSGSEEASAKNDDSSETDVAAGKSDDASKGEESAERDDVAAEAIAPSGGDAPKLSSDEAKAAAVSQKHEEATVEAAASEDTAFVAERARASEQPSSGDES